MKEQSNENRVEEKIMSNLYSIGETAAVMGISVQTLRKYSNLGLIEPKVVNEESGYRYYSADQFHILDKILYFRDLDVSLKHIKEAIDTNDQSQLLKIVDAKIEEYEKEIRERQANLEILKWYKENLQTLDEKIEDLCPYEKIIPERYVLFTDYDARKGAMEAETQLTRLRHTGNDKRVRYLRQHGFISNVGRLRNGDVRGDKEFLFVKEIPEDIPDYLRQSIRPVPAGSYRCFRVKAGELVKVDPEILKDLSDEQICYTVSLLGKTMTQARTTEYEIQIYLGK